MILRVGQLESKFGAKTSQTSDAQVVERHTVGPDLVPRGAGEGQVPEHWTLSSVLCRRCCESNLVPLHRWWTSLVLPRLAGGNYEWVSGLQMYVDFCFAVNGPWPIMVSGRWLERNEAVQRQYATTTFSRRIKMFLTLWNAYTQANKLVVPAMLGRPKSSCIAFWCQCYKLPWSRERLVDRILLGLLAHVDHSALFNIPIYKGKIFPLS